MTDADTLNPATDPEYQQYLAFKASREANPTNSPPEASRPSMAEVLKALVRSVNLPSEGTVMVFESVIDDHFAEKPVDSEVSTTDE